MQDQTPLLSDSIAIPYRSFSISRRTLASADDVAASFSLAMKNADRRRIPQTIAHRGYKAAFPENSMAAFEAAVKVGAHAVETDLHMTKDGVIVLSHVNFLCSRSSPPLAHQSHRTRISNAASASKARSSTATGRISPHSARSKSRNSPCRG
jgi:glycerophosphoryl diester phosphodiesterase